MRGTKNICISFSSWSYHSRVRGSKNICIPFSAWSPCYHYLKINWNLPLSGDPLTSGCFLHSFPLHSSFNEGKRSECLNCSSQIKWTSVGRRVSRGTEQELRFRVTWKNRADKKCLFFSSESMSASRCHTKRSKTTDQTLRNICICFMNYLSTRF